MLDAPTLNRVTPSVLLRNGTFRTVFNGVWCETLAAAPSCYAFVVQQMALRAPECSAGVVHTWEQVPGQLLPALTQLCSAVADLLCLRQLIDVKDHSAIAHSAVLMSMRGAQPHFDGQSKAWRNRLFWSLSLDDTDTDVLFGNLAIRVPQTRGTLLIFDGNQPHCLLAREHAIFQKNHFPKSRSQFFVGGDFDVKDWSALGASRHLTPQDLASHLDVLTMRINPKTCAVQDYTQARG